MDNKELETRYRDILNTLRKRHNRKRKVLESNIFTVGHGVIDGKDYFIPLKAISMVSVFKPAVSLTAGIVAIIISIFLFCLKITATTALGGWTLAFGILFIVIRLVNAKVIGYCLAVNLNNGYTFIVYSAKKEFLYKICDTMQKCIDEENTVYMVNAQDNSIHITKNYDDHSTNKTVVSGAVHAGRDLSIRNESKKLDDKDWEILTKFFDQKLNDVSPDRPDYNVYVKLDKCAKAKDEDTLRHMFRKSGMKAVNALIAGVGGVLAKTVTDVLIKLL